MPAKLNLVDKTRDEIAHALRDKTREELIDVIHSLATLEPYFSPATVASRRAISKRRVIALCKSGQLRAHKTLENTWRIPLSGVREWDKQTAVALQS